MTWPIFSYSQVTIASYDFESGTGGWTVASNGSGTGAWVQGSNAAHSAGATGNYFYSKMYSGEYNNNTQIIATSPAIDISGYTDITLQLSVWYTTENNYDGLKIEYSLNDGSTWSDLGQVTDTNWYNNTDVDAFNNGEDGWSGDSGGWVTKDLNLSAEDISFEGNSQVRLRVLFYSDYSETDVGVAFDSILIQGTPACTPVIVTPTAVTASPSTILEGSSTNLNATSAGNTINWYTSSSGGSSIGSSASGANFSVSPSTTTTYYAESDDGSCPSATRTAVTVTVISYCNSSGNGSDGYTDVIRYVGFNTITNSTNTEDNDYSDFTAISTDVIQNSAYNLSVNVNTGGNYRYHIWAWIDWNQDGDFNDAQESYDLGDVRNVTNSNPSLSPLSITVPNFAVLGNTRMRVTTKWDGNPTSCETGFDGEVEDYTINIITISGPEINVVGLGTTINNGDNSPTTTDNTLYGSTGTGSPISHVFTIQNTGNQTLTIGAISFSGANPGDFTVSSPPSSSIAASGSSSFTVDFNPSANGTRTAIISIINNDTSGGENPYTFTLQGTGLIPLTEAPGGVTADLALWLKANDGLGYTSGDNVSLWADQGRGSDATVNTTGQEPTYYDNASRNINFNPVVEFDNNYSSFSLDDDYSYDDISTQFLEGSSGMFTQDLFVVVIPDDTPINNSFGFMDIFCGDANAAEEAPDATGIGFGNYTGRIEDETITFAIDTYNKNILGDGYAVQDGPSTSYDNVGIVNARNNIGATQQELFYNANDIEYKQNDIPSFINVNNSRYWIGRSEGWEATANARIAEIITYSARKDDTNLTQERNKIQSYLAIKYGITLGVNGISQDYVNSDGTVIWDQSANTGYNYDIAGIGRDDKSELNQKQSKSVNIASDGTGPIQGILTIGLTDIYATNNQNITTNSANTFNDKEFLVWGNNGADLNLAATTIEVNMSAGITPALSTDVFFTGMQRVWKVVEIGGDVSKAKVSIPKSAVRNITPPGSYLMFISDTGVFDPTADYRVMDEISGNLYAEYDFDGTKYITFGYAPETIVERSIYFDGAVDYVDMEDALDLNTSEFTISAWIKRDPGTVNASIVSKRNATYTEGYDFKINGSGRFEFVLNGGTETLASSVVIPENEWHQVAVIYSEGNATLYIDGVADTSASGLPTPVATTQSFYIAAAGKNTPTNFFAGNIDEVRVWDTALSMDQLHYVMNQEIKENSTFVAGKVLPQGVTKNEVCTVPWSELAGYYPMSVYTYTNTNDMSGNGNQGALRNLRTVDRQTAPLPYVSTANTNWDTKSTWTNGNVQTIPGASSIVNNNITVDWNIVQISSNVSMNNIALPSANKGNRSVLGLIVDDSKELTADGTTTLASDSKSTGTGNGITVTHYLGLDGKIDLEGESQLVQSTNSDLVVGSNGVLERDQQGTGNIYRYNDWSSPVQQWYNGSTYSMPVDGTYNIAGVLRDGSTPNNPQEITFVGGYNGSVGPPLEIANYWLYIRSAKSFSSMDAAWTRVGSQGAIKLGEGFLMKGTGSTTDQNFVFQGKPNNGDITVTVKDDNDYLVGNPYPSAIDADKFIADNSTSIKGAIYFWDHFGGNSHNLKAYEAGHATYTYMGGVAAASNLSIHSNNPSASGSKTPGRFIGVGQAFYVDGKGTGDQSVIFNNSQRVFQKEDGGTNSVFMKSSGNELNAKLSNSKTMSSTNSDTRTKFRIGFNAPNGGHRQLLLGIDERASDGVDYGFDGLIYGLNNNDMYWEIDNEKYVIQGTNQYSSDSEFPMGIILNESGKISIEIDALENVEEGTKLYIKDDVTSETYDMSSSPVEFDLEAGEYSNRFLLVFQPRLLQLDEISLLEGITVYMDNAFSELHINRIVDTKIESVCLFNGLGQVIKIWNTNLHDRLIFLPINTSTGVYFIQITTSDGIINKKIIIE
ncbi:LamG-like jellyroll fold domain-containing protein [uncultured Lutibacter sp.]|uniref:LamG-like jellyroll fold domain-containing protein n=1 Tax=uncultured Lutibacter sp. TaxID=437739 RepID=UPI00260CDB5C|nr:LamG-like jellyroll fold domain-containing protein [uncultured Lutibacter sp.]